MHIAVDSDPRTGKAGPFLQMAAGLVRLLRERLRHRATVRALQELDERVLRDIGLGRGEIERAKWLGRP